MASRFRCASLTSLLLAACGNDDAPGDGGTTTDPSATQGSTVTLSSTTTLDTTTVEPTGDTSGSSDTGSGSDTTGESTGEPACPETHACIAVPEGWHGPAVLRTSTAELPAGPCPEGYPINEDLGGSELLAPDASCACSCGPAVGTTCSLSAELHYYGDDPTCSGIPLSREIFTTCNYLQTNFAAGGNWTLDPVQVEGGSCDAQATTEVEPAVFATTAAACSGAALLDVGCDGDEVCAPRAGDEALCIWQDGDEGCPDGFQRRALSFHRTIEDDRGCTACSCDDPVGLCDGAFAYLFQNVCNPPVAAAIVADGECHASSQFNSVNGAVYVAGAPSAFCGASETAASGHASGATPVTVCCN